MKETVFQVSVPEEFTPVITHVLQVVSVNAKASLVTLTGDLGAGKTTFTQQLAKHFGIIEPVTSPTFGIMKLYEITDNKYFDQLVHIDAYRIDDIAEAGPLRLAELFAQPRTLICLEWPEKIAEIIPSEKIAVTLAITKGEERTVTVEQSFA